ncbi:MAG: hypothetical protein LBE75_02940 [Burkholderiales bacterium]|jgi:subtilase family serine protease/flagellar hook assembly protein FlgD|nr:hypothetical protein [Burkholderiales bacterium]
MYSAFFTAPCSEYSIRGFVKELPKKAKALFVLSAFYLLSFSLLSVASDAPTIGGIPNTGNYTARFVEDRDNIAIVDLQGNYDSDLGDGKFNVEPRAVIAREFYKKHPDAYDFLVVFSSFEFDTGDALAFHHAVKRNVQGIGDRPLTDNTTAYGSAGRLQGFIDMAALSRYSTDPLSTDFDQVLQTFSHEFMHQWAAFARFRETDGTLSNDLLKGDGHWSFLLDSDASLMYGHHWRDNGNGTFTSVKAHNHFSPLDLYLMGLVGKEQVPPMTLLVAPGEDKSRLPQLGTTITAIPRTITIDDIIAAEGPRIPSAHDSQKDFRFAFIYVKRPGEVVSESQLTALSNIRREVGIRFNVLTQGLATANVFTEPTGAHIPGEPEVVVTEGPGQILADSTGAALTWLGLQQKGTGEWGDTEATAVRDTAYALHAFRELQPGSPSLYPGINWLQNKTSETTDALARQIIAGHIVRGTSPEEMAARLLALQNNDGGWGFAAGYTSNPLDTALAMQAIRKRQGDQATPFKNGRTWLVAHQNADGGWGNTVEGSSRVMATAQVLLALLRDGASDATVTKAAEFIAAKQNQDGGFGDSPSSQHDTAQAINTLMEAGTLENIRVNDAMQYLAARQQTNGSWENSVYTTALVVRVLNNARIMNWALESFFAEPQTVADGLPVTLNLKIRNTGGVTAPATKVRVYDGDPESGGVPIRADIELPQLGAGYTADVRIPWSTLGKAGEHTLFAVVDPDIEHQELTRDDNIASLAYTVQPAVAGIELFVTDADISITPQHPGQLPAQLTISALLTNAGTLLANQVKVVLWEGRANQPKVSRVGETTIDMPARATIPVQFAVTLNQGGRTVYTIEIDPENKIVENDKTNNTASITISPESNLDLSVDPEILMEPDGEIRTGNDVSFTVRLRNNGTVDSPTAQVRYSIVEGSNEYEIRTNNVQLLAGQSTEQRIDWRADREGGLIFKVQIDPQNLLDEENRTNNTAQKSFFVGERIIGPDLAVNFKDVSFDPDPGLEGHPLAIKALIRNIGTVDAGAFEVAFYAGIPNEGGIEIAERIVVNALASGESIEVTGTWEYLDRETNQFIYVVIDPDQVVADPNRANNHAFVVLEIVTLPDLAVGNGDITASPALPKPGDSVRISARISNLRQQTAENIIVRMYDGDPDAGGQPIGEDQRIEMLPMQTSEMVHFTYQMGVSAQTLYVVVDPDNLIDERYKENNKAPITLLSQDQDFYVSERYFSPNGDGVKDTTTLTFRLPEARTVHVEAVNEKSGRVARRSPEFTQVTTGSWEWDGINDKGSVAKDGSYLLRVVDGAGTVYGAATVELDTNRLPALDAIGMPYGASKQLQLLGGQRWGGQWQWTKIASSEDDSKHYYISDTRDDFGSVYLLDALGNTSLAVLQTIERFWVKVLPDRSGSVIALIASERRYQDGMGIWAADGDGSRLFKVATLPRFDSHDLNDLQLLLISEEDKSLLFSIDTNPDHYGHEGNDYVGRTKTLWRLPLVRDAVPLKVWEQEGYEEWVDEGCYHPEKHSYQGYSYQGHETVVCAHEEIAPNGSTVLFTARGEGEATQLTNLYSGQSRSLPLSSKKWFWSPDSRYFAGWAEIKDGSEKIHGMVIADQSGNIVYQKPYLQKDKWVNYGTWGEDGKFYFTEFDGCEDSGPVVIEGMGSSYYHEFYSATFSDAYSCRKLRLKAIAPGGNLEGTVSYEEDGYFTMEASGVIVDGDRTYPISNHVFDMGFLNGHMPDVQKLPLGNTLRTRGLGTITVPNQQQALFNGQRVDLEEAGKEEAVAFPQVGPWVGFDFNAAAVLGSVEIAERHGRWTWEGKFFGRFSASGKEIYYDYCDNYYYFCTSSPWVFHNLQNLTTELFVVREPDWRSFKIKGTASDKNFYRYSLEYSRSDAPETWRAIVQSSGTPVINDIIAPLWVPPGIGTYLVRLIAEDLAGNKQETIKRVSVGAWSPLSDFHLDLEWISPNGDGVQDETRLSYDVHDVGSYEFTIYNAKGVLVRTILKEYTERGYGQFIIWDGRDDNYHIVEDGEYTINILNYSFTVNVEPISKLFEQQTDC